jgi:hypothetical protein
MGSERNHQVPAFASGQAPSRPLGSLLLHGGERYRGIVLLRGRAGQYLARGFRGRAPALTVATGRNLHVPPGGGWSATDATS